jgi:predicted ribosome quality control (RQC) complex YloA/Tae2 family protein
VHRGYDVYVGRNARNNDKLTMAFARKDDLWLHAREAQGSHVVIRQKGKAPIPAEVVAFAAGLAAWYSKQRNSGLVAVLHTPRKYVRKSKRMAPGQVLVDRSETLLVPPLDPDTLR